MEIKVLWYESQGLLSELASEATLREDEGRLELVHVRTVAELHAALEQGDAGCVVVVHTLGDESWRDALRLVAGAAVQPVPTVLFLDDGCTDLIPEALLAGAWHAVPKGQSNLCAAAFKRAFQHAINSRACSDAVRNLKSAEEVLEKSQRNISLGLLLSSIAHEINNPLEGLANLLYLAKRGITNPQILEDYLDLSEAELSRISEITKQMLSFHRSAASRQEVSAAQLLDGVLTLFAARLRERQITVHRQYDSAGWMEAYAGELRQVLVNLVANAVDAMESGGRLTLRVRERGGPSPLLCVSIGDCGKGMSRETSRQLGKLFLTTKGDAGTGIGLWVTRRILQRHDGGLRVYSSQQPGRSGTVVCLSFPPPFAILKGNKERHSKHLNAGSREDHLDRYMSANDRKLA